jgi:hypothetical protein
MDRQMGQCGDVSRFDPDLYSCLLFHQDQQRAQTQSNTERLEEPLLLRARTGSIPRFASSLVPYPTKTQNHVEKFYPSQNRR